MNPIEDKLYAAVRYTLNRVQTDVDFRYYMLDSEAHRLLVEAEAAHLGEDPKVVMARRRADLRAPHRIKQLPHVEELKQRLEELDR